MLLIYIGQLFLLVVTVALLFHFIRFPEKNKNDFAFSSPWKAVGEWIK